MLTLMPTKTPKFTFRPTFTFKPTTRLPKPVFPTRGAIEKKPTVGEILEKALKIVPIFFERGGYIFFRDPATGEWHILPREKKEVIVQKGTILPPEIGEEQVPYLPSEYSIPYSKTTTVSTPEYPVTTPEKDIYKGLIFWSILAAPIILALIFALRR